VDRLYELVGVWPKRVAYTIFQTLNMSTDKPFEWLEQRQIHIPDKIVNHISRWCDLEILKQALGRGYIITVKPPNPNVSQAPTDIFDHWYIGAAKWAYLLDAGIWSLDGVTEYAPQYCSPSLDFLSLLLDRGYNVDARVTAEAFDSEYDNAIGILDVLDRSAGWVHLFSALIKLGRDSYTKALLRISEGTPGHTKMLALIKNIKYAGESGLKRQAELMDGKKVVFRHLF
jgi:hypothetical protein